MRNTCGTTANVSIIIAGEEGRTLPYMLKDDYRRVFEAGGVNSFLLTTSESLGSLTYVRIWHDNSGTSPSWYLSQISIKDVETEEVYHFLCDRWLACDEDDGQVDRLLPVASKQELGEFVFLFKSKTRRDFSDGHLWFSIVFRPPRSRFTCVQRVSCCLTLLLSSMLANVMWYQVEASKQNKTLIDLGFMQFSWHQLLIGIQSSLIVFPINLLIVQIFRHISISPERKERYLVTNLKENEIAKPLEIASSHKQFDMPNPTQKESTLSLTDISTSHKSSLNVSSERTVSTNFKSPLKKKSKHTTKQVSVFDDEDELFNRLLDSLEEEMNTERGKPGKGISRRQSHGSDHLLSDRVDYPYKNDHGPTGSI